MNRTHLLYFFRNFELAYATKLNWTEYNIGYDHTAAIQIAEPDFMDPLTHLHEIGWGKWKEKEIPFILNSSLPETIIEKTSDGRVKINADILSAGWYLMSGMQENTDKSRDKYGRFTHSQSLQKKLNITTVPVVNYYFDILKKAIEMSQNVSIDSHRVFSGTVTHDIDEVLSGWKHRIRTSLENKDYARACFFGISQVFRPFSPWKNLEHLAAYNSSKGVHSTFFFLPRNNKQDSIKNADYPLAHPYITKQLESLKKSNHEIGVHGSYRTHDIASELIADKQQISLKTVSNRFHFLQFDLSKTPQVLASSKFAIDSTLGFQEHIGFRNSICTPFYLYDFEQDIPFEWVEVPLNVMDCTLEFEEYMGLSPERALIEIKNLTQEIIKFNGNICLNWHNTYFSEYEKEAWKNLYKELIDWLIEQNCEFKTLRELL